MTSFWKKMLAGTLCGAMACAALAGCGATEAEATPVDLKLSGMRTEFAYGEAFSSSGLTVTIVYSDDTEQKANARNYTVDSSKYRADTAGDYEITVTCRELKKSYTVTVNEAREPEEQETLDWYEDGVLRILLIGHSYCEDSAEWLWELCNGYGLTAEIGLLWVGGASLSQHYQWATANTQSWTLQIKNTEQNGVWKITQGATFDATVKSADWDFIMLTQGSIASGQPESFTGVIDPYLEHIRSLIDEKTTKLSWLMPWADSKDSTYGAFVTSGYADQMDMYTSIVDTMKQVVAPRGVDVIPTGTALQNIRTSRVGDGVQLNRDGHHLSLGLGRYIAALTLFEKLTGLPFPSDLYAPPSVTEEDKEVAIESVLNAVAHPFEITESQYK